MYYMAMSGGCGGPTGTPLGSMYTPLGSMYMPVHCYHEISIPSTMG
jgi:hypothetical protein